MNTMMQKNDNQEKVLKEISSQNNKVCLRLDKT
jgi:hypothetical protein